MTCQSRFMGCSKHPAWAGTFTVKDDVVGGRAYKKSLCLLLEFALNLTLL